MAVTVPRIVAIGVLCLGCVFATAQTTVRRVTVFPNGDSVQVEISASGPVTPEAQVVTGPDRLVIDFPNSTPGKDLHNVSINRGKIKGLRVGLFAANPPVTRIVVDLLAPQPYEIVPSGSTIVLKLNGGPNQVATAPKPALTSVSSHPANAFASPPVPVGQVPRQVASVSRPPMNPASPQPANGFTSLPVPAAPVPSPANQPQPRMSVDFNNGKLKIFSDRATLAEVLTEVRRRTGADIAIPPSAMQEQVFGTLGPAAPREVMAALLNGSHFNFVMVGADNDPSQLRSVMLTPRDGAPASVPAIANQQPAFVEPPPDSTDPAPPLEPEPAAAEEQPSPDQAADPAPADNNAQAEPDMSPRHRHRRGAADTAPPQ
jgi:AMIN domain